MNAFKQHIPNFVEGVDADSFEFETLEDLLGNPFIQDWTKDYPDKKFHRFSISPYGDRFNLMAEFNKGKEWWVVGYLKEKVNLPIWEYRKQ